jgi:hypothetical protein
MDDNQDDCAPQLDEIDTMILNLVTASPDLSNNQIARKINNLTHVKSPQAVYQRLSRNSYLRGEISKLRDHIKQDHTRIVFPLARKRMISALKNKELHDKDVLPYVKLAYDKELSSKEEREQTVNTQINIESLQMMINKAIE